MQVDVEQHMGAPGHGKGTWDGEGGVLKSYAAKELRRENGVHLDCAQVCFVRFHNVVKQSEGYTALNMHVTFFLGFAGILQPTPHN